jgi:hypothetical protein
MDEAQRQAAFISALTTEHTVLQAASGATFTDAAARSSLYVFSLSSSLVAMGFAASSREAFLPFAAAVLPALFVLGVFTVVRLVDSVIENQRYLDGIARIRGYYRTLTPEAAELFAASGGRWPEYGAEPSQALGSLVAFLTTTATMVAYITSVVAGAGVALLSHNALAPGRVGVALALGAAAAVALMALFLVFQRWRFGMVKLSVDPRRHTTNERTTR